MKLRSGLTGLTSVNDIQVQKAISHLLFVKTGVAALTTETINVGLANGKGSVLKIASKIKVRDAAMLSQFENGFLSQNVVGGNIVSSYLVELTSDGSCIDLKGERYLSIDLDNMVAGSTYDIYGMEGFELGSHYLDYNVTSIPGTISQTKTYEANFGAYELGVVNNGSLSKIRFIDVLGREMSVLPEEWAAITREINDISQAADTLIEGDATNQIILAGAAEMYYFRMETISKFEITTTGTAELQFILVNKKPY